MKKPLLFLLFVIATDLAFFGYGVYAATTSITVNGSDTLTAICAKLTIPPVQPPTPNPAPTPSPTPPPPVTSGSEKILSNTFTTAYSNYDNTPRGSNATDLAGIHGTTGGTGTYADPITLAVGISIINGKEIPDFPYGTKFYVPNVRRYFSSRDACGDGSTPQNSACHKPEQGSLQLDLFIGGPNTSAVLGCEDALTDIHTVIQNPASNYAVVPGAIYDTGCQQYGNALITI